jgi:hypothetical protein
MCEEGVDFGQVVFEAMCEEGVEFGKVVCFYGKTKVIHMCKGGQHVGDHSLLLGKPNSIIGCHVGLAYSEWPMRDNCKRPFSIWRTRMKKSCS